MAEVLALTSSEMAVVLALIASFKEASASTLAVSSALTAEIRLDTSDAIFVSFVLILSCNAESAEVLSVTSWVILAFSISILSCNVASLVALNEASATKAASSSTLKPITVVASSIYAPVGSVTSPFDSKPIETSILLASLLELALAVSRSLIAVSLLVILTVFASVTTFTFLNVSGSPAVSTATTVSILVLSTPRAIISASILSSRASSFVVLILASELIKASAFDLLSIIISSIFPIALYSTAASPLKRVLKSAISSVISSYPFLPAFTFVGSA